MTPGQAFATIPVAGRFDWNPVPRRIAVLATRRRQLRCGTSLRPSLAEDFHEALTVAVILAIEATERTQVTRTPPRFSVLTVLCGVGAAILAVYPNGWSPRKPIEADPPPQVTETELPPFPAFTPILEREVVPATTRLRRSDRALLNETNVGSTVIDK